MKQLIALLLMISVIIISWSSWSKNEVTNEAKAYSLSSPIASHSLLSPVWETQNVDEGLGFIQAKVINEKNKFFEFSIIFNDKLQQIIAFFTHSDTKNSNVINGNFLSYSNDETTKDACKDS